MAVIMSVFIGLTMSLIYERKEAEKSSIKTFGEEEHKHTVELFILLIAVLVAPEFMSSWGGWKFTNQIIAWIPLIALTAYLSIKWFSKEELESWMGETWFLIKQITPLLLIGVFFAGIIVEVLPKEIVASLVGGNSIASNFVASIAAALCTSPLLRKSLSSKLLPCLEWEQDLLLPCFLQVRHLAFQV